MQFPNLQVRAAAGYVLQDDILPGTSTVWEFLCFHAALRLPDSGKGGAAAAASRVRALLRQLSLAKVLSRIRAAAPFVLCRWHMICCSAGPVAAPRPMPRSCASYYSWHVTSGAGSHIR